MKELDIFDSAMNETIEVCRQIFNAPKRFDIKYIGEKNDELIKKYK